VYVLFLQNISSFSEKDFNVVDWINTTLKDKPPDQCREVYIVDICIKLYYLNLN